MIILGIDPGLERIGWGVVQKTGSKLVAIEYGLIKTPRVEIGQRLQIAHAEMKAILEKHNPECVASERLFFAKNQTTAMDVAKALGVVMLAVSQHGLECCEYSPPQIKLSVVGTGSAEKKQVQYMVTRLLKLKETPKPDDVADALAVAITHALRAQISAVIKG